nr:Chain C, SRC1 [Homo sapiens]5GIE_C Chain C, SRC1 [Homo sapiens]5GIE_E Chain E, SRC1 [Homo sapiens]7OXU_B Chain B, Mediator of RNA polymerase II transcription subunit 1 [Homo sapiens]
NHPMLMNLLK